MDKIFSESEKLNILNEARKNQPRSETQLRMYCEVIAGLRIINRFLGDNWYQKAKREILDGTFNNKKEHPVANYLRFDKPEKMIKLLSFANYIRNLHGVSNVEEKIEDYVKRERHTTITTEKFDKIYTELKAANYFTDKDFRVNFIKEQRDRKTPDFQVFAKDGSALVECKRKKEQEKLIIDNILETVLDANEQLENAEIAGIIFVDIPFGDEVKPEIIKKVEATKLEDVFPHLDTVHYVIIGGEGVVKAKHRTIPNLVRVATEGHWFSYENKMSDLKLPPSLESSVRDITISRPRSLLAD